MLLPPGCNFCTTPLTMAFAGFNQQDHVFIENVSERLMNWVPNKFNRRIQKEEDKIRFYGRNG